MRHMPTEKQINAVLESYGLGPLSVNAERLGGASNNANLSLDTLQGKYFCRVRSSYGDQDALLHRVLIHLTDKGFPAAPLLRTVDGETYVQHENRIYELFPFMQGEDFVAGNHEQFASMGGAIAQFHLCMEDFDCSIPFERFVGRGYWNNYPHLQRLERNIEYTEREIANNEGPAELKEKLAELLAQTRQAMEDVTSVWKRIESCIPGALVHGDYHLYNVQFKGREVAYICDFDFVMPAERIFDIITAFVWWMQGERANADEQSPPDETCLRPYREFLASYNEQTKQVINSHELQAMIPDMQRLILLYGSKAAMHHSDLEGMLDWLKAHLKRAEWLGRHQMEFEQGLRG